VFDRRGSRRRRNCTEKNSPSNRAVSSVVEERERKERGGHSLETDGVGRWSASAGDGRVEDERRPMHLRRGRNLFSVESEMSAALR